MKHAEKPAKRPRHLKRKLTSALVMLMIATVLLTTTTYAWLVLSIAPEVRGISTSIGGNGSLEIALLNSGTRQDLTTIGTAVGNSLSDREGDGKANETWGNLVDLEVGNYGLEDIVLLPARLNVTGDAANVDRLLAVPTYGFDGRIESLNTQTFSTTYTNNGFTFQLGAQDYGVRAIGTADAVTVQQAALAAAKSNIGTYTNSAKAAAKGAMADNADALFGIILAHASDANGTFDNEDLDALSSMLTGLQSAYGYIDLALRQGLVAMAASEIGDATLFETVQDRINSVDKVVNVLSDLEEVSEVPEEFAEWATTLADSQNTLNVTQDDLATLRQNGTGAYTWQELSAILKPLMDMDQVLINGTPYPDFDKSSAMDLVNAPVELLLGPGSGEFATVADFTDDYSANLAIMGGVTIRTATAKDPVYLVALRAAVNELEAAESEGADTAVEMTDTYAYALDLAFRCNAPLGNLLLQTAGAQRVYDDSISATTMGGGSYMAFTSFDEGYSLDQRVLLMDSVRVAFLDDVGTILGIAKLNTSNTTYEDDTLKAPLYLYDYEFVDDGTTSVKMLAMGERRKTDNIITDLKQNVAKAVTVVVWLDGDVVDNTMVSASESVSLSGSLNLQFATDADLVPAENNLLKNLVADKSALNDLVNLGDYPEVYNQGQQTWTTVSWQAFVAAYDYAVAVNDSELSGDIQVYNAVRDLTQAYAALEEIDITALGSAIDEMRHFMGQTHEVAGYVVKNLDASYSFLSEYTEAQIEGYIGTVNQVNYNNNLRDEGNDVHTPIYTDESWNALAAALYHAEAIYMMKDSGDESVYITDARMDDAITALDYAYEALEHRVFFTPYDYNGSIYYYAYPANIEDTDTYGQWYDADFKRVVSDRTIILLDADAEEVTAGIIDVADAYRWDSEPILPYFSINHALYSELKSEEITALIWNEEELYEEFFVEMMSARHVELITALISEAQELAATYAGNQDKVQKINSCIATGHTLLDNSHNMTAVEADAAIGALEQRLWEATRNDNEESSGETVEPTPLMTFDQRIVLTAAVNAAKAVEGYDEAAVALVDESSDGATGEDVSGEEEKRLTHLKQLRAAVTEAETLLDKVDSTQEDADSALEAINTELTELGEKEVTAYNTIVHTIPVYAEESIVYSVTHPTLCLGLTGKTGTATIRATLLTKNGVVMRAETQVTIYTPFDELRIQNQNEEKMTEVTVSKGQSLNCIVAPIYNAERDDEELTLGNWDGSTAVVGDQIGEYVWTVVDWSGKEPATPNEKPVEYTDIVSVEPSASGDSCVVKGLSEGWVTIRVTGYSAYDEYAFISQTVTINVTETGA